MRIAVILRHSFAVAFRWRRHRPNQKVAAIDNAIASIDATILADRGTGAVVEIVSVTTEPPLPDCTCVGLKAHGVSAGRVEQLKLTLPGNVPVVGETSTLAKHPHYRGRSSLLTLTRWVGLRLA